MGAPPSRLCLYRCNGSGRSRRRDPPESCKAPRPSSGRPVFPLFHSLTCDPCVEISANVDDVVPGYQGKVEFVNAITDDTSGQQLAAGFNFQYIPTSSFFNSKGELIDSYTGVLSVEELRVRLDNMVTQ